MTPFVPVPSRRRSRGWDGRFFRKILMLMLTALLVGVSWGPSAHRAIAAVQPQAAILDPFPSQHSPGYDGQDIIDVLQTAGFKVTILSGPRVTVPVMLHLSRYAIIYIFTHSGPLPNNDAAVSTGDTRHQKFARYFDNSTLVRMHIVSDTGFRYFDAVTGRFIRRYSGTFSPHSIVFLNACTALGMPLFWRDLQAAGVGTFISWRHHVNTVDADQAALEFFAALAHGQTVDQAMHTIKADGAGISLSSKKVGTLGFSGEGQNTLQQAESGATLPALSSARGPWREIPV